MQYTTGLITFEEWNMKDA